MNELDFKTEAWKRFASDMNKRLAELRQMNDKPSLNAEQTAVIRGKIAEVKRILALPTGSASEGGGADYV